MIDKHRLVKSLEKAHSNLPIVIACAADDGYAMPMAVMLYSAMSNYGGASAAEIYILDGGISPAHREKIRQVLDPYLVTIHWVTFDLSTLNGLPLRKYLTPTTYARLLISDVVPGSIEKVIYLDCDLLVCRDLATLWAKETGSAYYLAAQDPGLPLIAKSSLAGCPEVQFSATDEYFNAGLMVMNLAAWRRENIGQRAIEFIHRWPAFVPNLDQDGLNALGLRRWGKLEPAWNVTSWDTWRTPEFGELPDVVIHFIGKNKPWRNDISTRYLNADASRLYGKYLRASGWFNPFERNLFDFKRAWGRYKSNRNAVKSPR